MGEESSGKNKRNLDNDDFSVEAHEEQLQKEVMSECLNYMKQVRKIEHVK